MTELQKQEDRGLDTLAEEINAEHRKFVESFKKTAEHGIRAGELLTKAKTQCKHGEWLPWLETNFEGSVRSAQVYMQLYNNRDRVLDKNAESAHLSISSALREIASPASLQKETPPETTTVSVRVVEEESIPIRVESIPIRATTKTEEPNTEAPSGVIPKILEHPRGAQELAKINAELEAGKARDRVRNLVQKLRWALEEVSPEEYAREVLANQAAENVHDVVMERSKPATARTLAEHLDVEPAEKVHDWIASYLNCLEHLAEDIRKNQKAEGQERRGAPDVGKRGVKEVGDRPPLDCLRSAGGARKL